jgi:hypothetical protein
MISYVIRTGQNGYPPFDRDVLEYMRYSSFMDDDNVFLSPEYQSRVLNKSSDPSQQQERKLNIWFHALAVGMLRASFEICKYFLRVLIPV